MQVDTRRLEAELRTLRYGAELRNEEIPSLALEPLRPEMCVAETHPQLLLFSNTPRGVC